MAGVAGTFVLRYRRNVRDRKSKSHADRRLRNRARQHAWDMVMGRGRRLRITDAREHRDAPDQAV
ncbi:MAG: hypothetical protein WDN24_01110 [Sphingomonas sp.]